MLQVCWRVPILSSLPISRLAWRASRAGRRTAAAPQRWRPCGPCCRRCSPRCFRGPAGWRSGTTSSLAGGSRCCCPRPRPPSCAGAGARCWPFPEGAPAAWTRSCGDPRAPPAPRASCWPRPRCCSRRRPSPLPSWPAAASSAPRGCQAASPTRPCRRRLWSSTTRRRSGLVCRRSTLAPGPSASRRTLRSGSSRGRGESGSWRGSCRASP
mmetsp:Transcript_57204/g.162405  ORF Transcript_57204/g.162405 Transcript_57204/m.162405 type:complete len:211 (-) Transcript_57204:869-1501(-)